MKFKNYEDILIAIRTGTKLNDIINELDANNKYVLDYIREVGTMARFIVDKLYDRGYDIDLVYDTILEGVKNNKDKRSNKVLFSKYIFNARPSNINLMYKYMSLIHKVMGREYFNLDFVNIIHGRDVCISVLDILASEYNKAFTLYRLNDRLFSLAPIINFYTNEKVNDDITLPKGTYKLFADNLEKLIRVSTFKHKPEIYIAIIGTINRVNDDELSLLKRSLSTDTMNFIYRMIFDDLTENNKLVKFPDRLVEKIDYDRLMKFLSSYPSKTDDEELIKVIKRYVYKKNII